MLSEGDVNGFIDCWGEDLQVEAAEQRVGVLSQALLDIGSLQRYLPLLNLNILSARLEHIC